MAINSATAKPQIAMRAAETLAEVTKKDPTMGSQALQEAQQKISGGTQVAATPTCPAGTCPNSVGGNLNVTAQ